MKSRGSPLFLGVDVGTGSVRAGVFTRGGVLVGHGTCPIRTWREGGVIAEQSSYDIWHSAGQAVRESLREAGTKPERVAGLGYDATCSLVALDSEDRPVTVSTSGRNARNVVLWMDHRAGHQADRANATRSPVLRHVGGRVSLEMEIPKLLWIRTHLPRSWKRASRFFDLADFMAYRSTGADLRSLCTMSCKWNYMGHRGPQKGWDEDGYLRPLGLLPLIRRGMAGESVVPLGTRVGSLLPKASRELGLCPGLPVAAGMIDAHAGGVGLLGLALGTQHPQSTLHALNGVLALIGGTSSCHMAVSARPRFVKGVWGPYYGAMLPGLWLNEGGQSATGALLDHLITGHAASPALEARARREARSVYEILDETLDRLAARTLGPRAPVWHLAAGLHVLPDHHGNRSPRADPAARGMVSGLSLDPSLEDLARIYQATLLALAYGTRHIVEALNHKGYAIRTLLATGGGTKNPAWLRAHADAGGFTILQGREEESVLLGAAIQGAVASGTFSSFTEAMRAMSSPGRKTIADPRSRAFHEAKYRVFQRMYEDQRGYASSMEGLE